MMPLYPHASLEDLLESSTLLEDLSNTLSNALNAPGPLGCFPKARPATGHPTEAKPESGEPLLRLVTSLVVRQVPGLEAIWLLGVQENANVVLVQSLSPFLPTHTPPMSIYEESLGIYLSMALLLLTGIHFSPNFSLWGVSHTKFETHAGGLDLKTGVPNSHAQQVAVDSDEDILKVLSHGLFLLPSYIVVVFLELGKGITISEVAEKLYPHLFRWEPVTTAFNTALGCIQASVTDVKWEESPWEE